MTDCLATRLHDLAEHSPTMLAAWDADLRCEFANEAYETWFGVDPSTLPGSSLEALLGPHLFGLNRRFIDGALRGEPQEFERTIPGPDRVRHSLARYTPRREGGRVAGFFVEVTDISALKAAERLLIERVADLEQRIVYYEYLFARRGTLRGPADEHAMAHRSALKQATTLAGQIAHELQQSLAPVCTGLERLNAAEPVQAGTARTRQTMARHLSQMGRLLDDLVECAGIESGTLSLRRERVAASEVVAAAASGCAATVAAAHQQLRIEVPEDLVLYCDPVRIAQVLANLIDNASRYSAAGASIAVTGEASLGGAACLSVVDDGAGMPPEAAARLFAPGVQRDHTISRARGGIGIGLMFVKQVVEEHGGSVHARSAGPGKGTTLSFILPRADLSR